MTYKIGDIIILHNGKLCKITGREDIWFYIDVYINKSLQKWAITINSIFGLANRKNMHKFKLSENGNYV